jgi:hypothetical protein
MRRTDVICAVLLSLLVPADALAQRAGVNKEAEDQFRQGREAAKSGDCKTALGLYRASHATEPNRGKLLNIAICEEQLGQLATALGHFQEAAPQFTGKDDRLAIARQHIEALTPRVPRLLVHLKPHAPSGTEVKVDGALLATASLDATMPVDPGAHVITVSAPGVADRRYDLNLEVGRIVRISVAPAAREEEAPPPPPPPALDGARRMGFIVGGAGIAGVLVGSGIGFAALAKHTSLDDACPAHRGCSRDVVEQAGTGKTLSVASTVVFATGLVGVGAGTFLVLWGSKRKSETAAFVLPTPGGFKITGRF